MFAEGAAITIRGRDLKGFETQGIKRPAEYRITAEAHRTDSVTVVSEVEREEFRFRFAADIAPVLKRHLKSSLDGG